MPTDVLPPSSDQSSESRTAVLLQKLGDKPVTESGGNEHGGVVHPRYGERRPMTYQLFETEMERISSLNSQAVLRFSIAGFCLSIAFNLAIQTLFSASPLSESAHIVSLWGLVASVVFSVMFYVGGYVSVRERKTDIERIKREHILND